jgi:hypothetical protein
MPALRGNLVDFGIAEVFQLIGQQRKTGVLEITHDKTVVQLVFDSGSVVRAEPLGDGEDAALADLLLRCGALTREKLQELEREAESSLRRLGAVIVERGALPRDQLLALEDLLTRETLFQVLRWSTGSFAFNASAVEHDREGHLLAAEQILMDGLRMADEWRTFAGQVPSDDTVFQRTGRFEDFAAARDDDGGGARRVADARRVFLLVDGRLSARRVIDLSRLGTFECTRILAELRGAGLIEPVAAEQLEKRRTQRIELGPPPSRPLLAGALPLVILAALAFGAPRAGGPSAPDDAFLLGRAPLADARAAFATERVRRALEAWRFTHGAWPERLEQLVEDGLLPRDALTPAEADAYYYERLGEEAVLLAPPR